MQKDRLLELYRQMYLIRRFEEASAEAYFQAQIRGFCHLYVGEEAVAVGAVAALRDTDTSSPTTATTVTPWRAAWTRTP